MGERVATTEAPKAVQKIKLEELKQSELGARAVLGENIDLIRNVRVRLNVSIGGCELTVKELFALKEGSVIALNKATREPVDILLDGKIIARGGLIAVDDNFGVRITEIVAP